MKLLLTSSGLINPSIISALEDLLGKSAQGARLAFIPTAANVESGDKSWMIDVAVVSEGKYLVINE